MKYSLKRTNTLSGEVICSFPLKVDSRLKENKDWRSSCPAFTLTFKYQYQFQYALNVYADIVDAVGITTTIANLGAQVWYLVRYVHLFAMSSVGQSVIFSFGFIVCSICIFVSFCFIAVIYIGVHVFMKLYGKLSLNYSFLSGALFMYRYSE